MPLPALFHRSSCNRPALPAPRAMRGVAQGLETYKGSVDCVKSILKNHGIKGLYRGMTSTILRDIQVGPVAGRCAARTAFGSCSVRFCSARCALVLCPSIGGRAGAAGQPASGTQRQVLKEGQCCLPRMCRLPTGFFGLQRLNSLPPARTHTRPCHAAGVAVFDSLQGRPLSGMTPAACAAPLHRHPLLPRATPGSSMPTRPRSTRWRGPTRPRRTCPTARSCWRA